MNAIESLQQYIARTYPEATTNISRPASRGEVWSLDVRLAHKDLAIEWSPRSGFGITNPSLETFGETSDEHVESLESARLRIDDLLTTNEHTSPSLPILLSRLRERRGLTQQALARRLKVSQ